MRFSFVTFCLSLWIIAILPAIMMWVSTILYFVNPLIIVPALYALFVLPAVVLWYNFKKKEGTLPLKGFKVRPPEQVLDEYLELTVKSGEQARKRTST